MIDRPLILLCGPARTAVSGVATHLNQLFDSELADKYSLSQFQVGSEGRNEGRFGKLVRYLTSPFVFFWTLIRKRPQIVHLNSSMEAKSYWRDLAYLFAARLLGRKVVYQVHGGEVPARFLGHNPLSHAFLRFTLRLPSAVVLLAEVELDEYRAFGLENRLEIVPNAIDLDDYRDFAAKSYARDNVALGYIGRLADDKGIKETIEAVASLRERGDQTIRLSIAGSGPYEDDLRALARAKNLTDVVTFVGPIFDDEKLEFWKRIDVFVFPTFHREGLPYTILESLASGTPMITTRIGGIPDVVRNNVEGILLDAGDPDTVASAIDRLLADRNRLREMSAASIRRAREHYGVERLARQFDRLYTELLA